VEDRFTPAAVSRYLTGAFVWDTRRLEAQRFLQGMAAIGQELNRPTVVIATSDFASVLMAEHADALRRWFHFPEQPATLPRTLANKKELYRLCQRLGVPCAATVVPQSLDDVREFVARARFPVVVKAAEPWLLPAGSRTTSIGWTPQEVLALYQGVEGALRSNLMLQEFIDLDRGEDWFYNGYRNARSGCCIGFTGRKLRSYPVLAGPTTLAKALANEQVRRQAEGLLQAVSYAGISDLDFRLDTRDGQYKLLDFNPRIGAQFRLFEDDAGVDVARALYLDLTGKQVRESGSAVGRTFLAEFHDLAASLGYLWRGKLTFREWRQSLKGRREVAWFSGDDPLPFVMVCVRLLFRVAERLLRAWPTSRVSHWSRQAGAAGPGFQDRESPQGVQA
jgi:predicted ATP-grasp superfamily ATP-dependent carboligase